MRSSSRRTGSPCRSSTSASRYSATVRSVPENLGASRPGSGCPASDSAASRSPAAHPSVRSTSGAGSGRSTPAAANSSAASATVNRRSGSRISASSPSSRSRCSPSRTSCRVASTNRSPGGARMISSSSCRSASGPSSCTSSTTSHNWSSSGARSASSRSVISHPSRSGAAVSRPHQRRPRRGLPQRGQHRQPEPLRITLAAPDRHPRGAARHTRPADPGPQQHRLAAARRRRHHAHPGRPEPPEQPGTGNDTPAPRPATPPATASAPATDPIVPIIAPHQPTWPAASCQSLDGAGPAPSRTPGRRRWPAPRFPSPTPRPAAHLAPTPRGSTVEQHRTLNRAAHPAVRRLVATVPASQPAASAISRLDLGHSRGLRGKRVLAGYCAGPLRRPAG